MFILWLSYGPGCLGDRFWGLIGPGLDGGKF